MPRYDLALIETQQWYQSSHAKTIIRLSFSIAIIHAVFVFVICDMIVKGYTMMRSWLTQILHLGSLQLRIVDLRISIVDMPP